MSVKATSAVWEQSAAVGPARLVLLSIADHADPVGVAWPSVARLARMCQLSGRSVQKHILSLEELGELRRSFNEGRRGTNVYEILLNFDENSKKKGVQKPPSESTPRQNRHPVNSEGSPPSIPTPPPVNLGSEPLSESTPEPLRTTKKQEREPAREELGEESPSPSDFQFCLEMMAELFPLAIVPLPDLDRRLLEAWQNSIVELNPEDFEALTCWFVHADDEARGRKKWPRDRKEFLQNFTEAIEKVREWWQERGQAWWERKERARIRATQTADEEQGEGTPANWREILNGDTEKGGAA